MVNGTGCGRQPVGDAGVTSGMCRHGRRSRRRRSSLAISRGSRLTWQGTRDWYRPRSGSPVRRRRARSPARSGWRCRARNTGRRRGGSPSQRAASTRRMWPLENTSTLPATARTRATTRSARAPTSAGDSPPGQPSRNSCQPGRPCEDLGRAASFVVAVVPLDEIAVDLRGGAEARELAGPLRALQRTREHLRERHVRASARRACAHCARRARSAADR